MTPEMGELSHEKWRHYGEWRHKHGSFDMKSGSITEDATSMEASHEKWQHYGE
ncbi:hypothetical protein [Metabacillus indicus]|uniref:hypothetical protein n=1 Tax=Metabacillus indicus TaxID=246786 RepID=UPI003CF2C945